MAFWLGFAALLGAAVLVATALYSDAKRREIPQHVPIGVAALWLAVAFLSPAALDATALAGLACGVGALGVGYVFHFIGWLGAGDGKLLAALALWMGDPLDLSLWLLAVAALGLVLVLIALARPNGDFRARGIPFAWAIAPPAATLLVARALALGDT